MNCQSSFRRHNERYGSFYIEIRCPQNFGLSLQLRKYHGPAANDDKLIVLMMERAMNRIALAALITSFRWKAARWRSQNKVPEGLGPGHARSTQSNRRAAARAAFLFGRNR